MASGINFVDWEDATQTKKTILQHVVTFALEKISHVHRNLFSFAFHPRLIHRFAVAFIYSRLTASSSTSIAKRKRKKKKVSLTNCFPSLPPSFHATSNGFSVGAFLCCHRTGRLGAALPRGQGPLQLHAHLSRPLSSRPTASLPHS